MKKLSRFKKLEEVLRELSNVEWPGDVAYLVSYVIFDKEKNVEDDIILGYGEKHTLETLHKGLRDFIDAKEE